MGKVEELEARADRAWNQILTHLSRVREHYGRGWLGRLDRLIGKQQGYLANVLTGKRALQPRELCRSIAALGLEPEEFFEGAFGFSLPVYLHELERRWPGQVLALERRLKKEAPGSVSRAALLSQVAGLEEQRLTVTLAAERGCYQAIRALRGREEPAAECEAFGVLAAILRGQGRFSAAAFCLRRALQLVRGPGFEAVRARTLQRASYLLADQGDFDSALEVLKKATFVYIELGDSQGIGRSFIDTAIVLGKSGKLANSARLFGAGLANLPRTDWSNRCSALHGLGLSYARLGQLDRAAVFLKRGIELLSRTRTDAPRFVSSFVWLRGEIFLVKGMLEHSREDFELVKRTLLKHGNKYDVALISLRIAKVLTLQGNVEELQELASGMITIVAACSKNRLVEGFLMEFIRAAMSGQLSIEEIDRIYEDLRGASAIAEAPPLLSRGRSVR